MYFGLFSSFLFLYFCFLFFYKSVSIIPILWIQRIACSSHLDFKTIHLDFLQCIVIHRKETFTRILTKKTKKTKKTVYNEESDKGYKSVCLLPLADSLSYLLISVLEKKPFLLRYVWSTIVLYLYSGVIIVVRQNLCNISLSIPIHPPCYQPPGAYQGPVGRHLLPYFYTFNLETLLLLLYIQSWDIITSLHSINRHYYFFKFNQETLLFLCVQSRDIIIPLNSTLRHYYFLTFHQETLLFLCI